MPDRPDQTPLNKTDEAEDKWPHTMRHYKWEKKTPEHDAPSPADDATPKDPTGPDGLTVVSAPRAT